MERVVAVGDWLYDDKVPTRVLVVETDYDFWYAVGEANGDLEPDEQPALNAEGRLYYVRAKPGWSEGEPFWPDGQSHPTVQAAKEAAEGDMPTPITWQEYLPVSSTTFPP